MTPAAARLQAWLRTAVGELLTLDAELLDPDRPLSELGMSSRDAMVLVGELEGHLDRSIDPTVIWRAPTIAMLAELLGDQDSGRPTRPGHPPGPEPAPAGEHGPGRPTRAASLPSGSAAPDARAAHDVTGALDPVAVVGLGCRLPGGVAGPAAFWQQLLGARESVGDLPAGRWEHFPPPSAASAAAVAAAPRRGGFLADIAGFDAEHFGITPREARVMDPQQRLLLEVAWEALSHAGIAPPSLAGTATGVWIGMSTNEYSLLTMADLSLVDAWTPTGSALSIAANRLSYLLDLRGPSVTLDTACSSSLVAVQQAVRAIRAGEIDTALVGGVNLLLSPAVTVTFHRGGALAPDGRCKPFGADADGIVRAEAAGIVVLKRLSLALADGDRVLAVIRAAEVNSDGRSNGLMAPNPIAQEDLLRRAYAAARIDPGTVDYVEAHGTGTLLGDPIEAAALASVLGSGRPAGRPLLIGSVKSNLGHTESAAGVVGLIKTVLALRHGLLPASLNATVRNPHIPFDDLHLDVVTRLRPWPRYGGTARAGVSAFGFGGTNAHVVLEEWPEQPRRSAGTTEAAAAGDEVVTAVLTGDDAGRVRQWADLLAGQLAGGMIADPLGDLAHTLARRRRHGRSRAIVTGRGRTGLVEGLRALAEQRDLPGVVAALPAARPGAARTDGAVWVFSGHGSHWEQMGARLLAEEPAFAAAVEEVTGPLAQASGVDLRAVLTGSRPIAGILVPQIAIFGVQIALAAAWRAHGHRPAAVIGQSLGEVAAAVVAGALDLPDGIRVLAVRSGLLERAGAGGGGAMAVLELSSDELDALSGRFADVVIAVHASPRQLTVAGPAAQVLALAEQVEDLGRHAWVLPVSGAGHSPAVEPVLDDLVAQLAGITPGVAGVPFYTTVLDDPRRTPAFDPGYWRANLRGAVRFAQAVSAAAEDGHRIFVEVSPHPVALPAVGATLAARGLEATLVPSLRRGCDDTVAFRSALAVLATTPGYRASGVPGDPEGLGIASAAHADLPAAPWRHVRHWVEPVARGVEHPGPHPFLGARVQLPGENRYVFAGDLAVASAPWLSDHRVHGAVVFPAAGFAELALAAAGSALAAAPDELELTELELHRLLVLADGTAVTVTTEPAGQDAVRVDTFARTGSGTGSLQRHATALVARLPVGSARPSQPGPAPGRVDGDGATPVDVYATFAAAGHRYGPAFSGVAEAFLRPDGSALARVRLPAEATRDPRMGVHPALLDACLQVLAPAAAQVLASAGDPRGPVAYLPFAIGALRTSGATAAGGWCHASVRALEGPGGLVGQVRLVGDDGSELLRVDDVLLRPLPRGAIEVPLSEKTFELTWQEQSAPAGDGGTGTVPARVVVVGTGSLAAALATAAGVPLHHPDSAAAAVLAATAETAPGAPQVLLSLEPPAGRDPATGGAGRLILDLAAVVAALVRDPDDADPAGAGRPAGGPARIRIVTRGGATFGDRAGSPALGAVRAVVRVLAFEHPRSRTGLLDLDPDAPLDVAVAQALSEVRSGARDDEVAWRGGRRLVRRLERAAVAPAARAPRVRAGAYVVTGGLGGLGLLVARHLAGLGATRLVLAGRSADPALPTPQVAELIAAVGPGVEVLVVRADVSRARDVRAVFAAATQGGVPVRGVLHAAGVLADELVGDLTEQALERVWAPKVLGGWLLHEASVGLDLDLWCVFSSAAGMLGSPGQLSYATANSWLDGLVELRRAQGLPGTTIAWGAWLGAGGADPSRNALLDPISPAEGLAALDAVLASGRSATGVVRLDLDRMVALLPDLAELPFFSPVLAGRSPGSRDEVASWPGAAALRAADPAVARDLLRARLATRISAIMGCRPERLDPTVPLSSLGVDSLMAVRAKNAVEHDVEVNLPVRLLLQGASLDDLEAYLADQLGLASGTPPTPADAPAAPAVPSQPGAVPTAVIGPRDTTERWLFSVWSGALGRADFGVTTPLAPLLAAGPAAARSLVEAQLATRFGTEIDTAGLLAGASVQVQADLARRLFEASDGPLRLLRSPEQVTAGGDGLPLFLFHPAGGPTSVYQPLVALLPGDRPVYGLERIEAARTVEDKVTCYLELIRRLQPGGPYRLGGWSFGGALAYEAAARLVAEGEQVDVVLLIDSILPDRVPGADERAELRERFVRFVDHLHQTYGVALDLDLDHLLDLDDDTQVDLLMAAVSSALTGVGPALLEHQRTSYVDARVAERYHPRPYAGRVVLYRATDVGLSVALDPRYARQDDALGWDLLCPGLEIVTVPGDHISIIDRPRVDVIATHLTAVLAELGAAERTVRR